MFLSARIKKWIIVLTAIFLPIVLFWVIRVSQSETVSLPVLMYHHIDQDVPNDMTISSERFEEQIATLTEQGWHSIGINQLIDFVENGTPLPSKPFMITFDDGYASNLDIAVPILEKFEQHAIIFVIGINAGKTHYVHNGQLLSPPRFALDDAAYLCESGVIEIQSHTFDLHQRSNYNISGREGVLALPQESEEKYRDALILDCQQQKELFSTHFVDSITALSYPFGFSSDISEEVFAEQGIKVTFTTTPGPNTIEEGNLSSLRRLNRYAITERMAGADVIWLLEQK